MRKKIVQSLLALSAVIAEALPYGVIFHYCVQLEDGSLARRTNTYPYFDTLPFFYANVGPLITAYLSVLLLVLDILFCFWRSSNLWKAIRTVSVAAFLFSLLALFFNFNVVSTFISALLFIHILFTSQTRVNT